MNIHLDKPISWSEREKLPVDPGVYVISKGHAENIIYIGKTWGDDGLRGRIRSFNRSATTGKPGHAGGVTYYSKLWESIDDLQVSVHIPRVINTKLEILYAYISYVERRLIWEFVERCGWMPPCNTDSETVRKMRDEEA